MDEMSRDRRVPWQLGRLYSEEVNVIVWADLDGQARQRASDWASDTSYLDAGSTWCKRLEGGVRPGLPVVGTEAEG